MREKSFLHQKKYYRVVSLIILAAILTSSLSGCGIFELFLSKKPKTISMSASGIFDEATFQSYCKFPENSIELGWSVDQGSGDARSEVTGSGKFNRTCSDTDLENIRLYFEGSVDKDGKQYTGTVQLLGSFLYDGVEYSLDKTQNWNAIREGDYIYGVVEGLAPFELKVNPAKGVGN